MLLTLSYAEERGQAPSRDPHTGEGRGGNPHVHEPKSFYKVKIDGKSRWAPGGRGVRPREVGVLLISGPGPSPGSKSIWGSGPSQKTTLRHSSQRPVLSLHTLSLLTK